MDADGRLQPLLGVINGDNPKDNTTLNGSLAWFEDISENPGLNDVEVWEVYNATEDAHPIHLHLVSFQILDRTPFEAVVNTQDQIQHDERTGIGGYIVESSINFTGTPIPPAPNERGWKDTFVVPPGYMGRVIAKFDRPGRYVWHCHILSHEDHEMMRPFHVGPIPPPPGGGKKGAAVGDQAVSDWSGEFRLYPNPASELITVDLMLEQGADVSVSIFGLDGRKINSDALGYLNDGLQSIAVPVDHLDNGMYILELKAGSKQFRESILISK
jgi:spore coat protein A